MDYLFDRYIARYKGLTFDLHYSEQHKAEGYKIWVRRIYAVASILHFSYSELWDLSEQEFLVLEELSQEIVRKQKEARQQLLEKDNKNG